MKILRKDTVLVISGKYKGKKGEVVAVMAKTNQVVVEGINVAKKHTKPTQSNPTGGILEITKPIAVNKVMIIDPTSGKPARVGYTVDKNGKKARIFKVSKFKNATKKATKKPVKKTEVKK